MNTHEILTFQLGHYANFVGAHWWNIQESGFEYNSANPSLIDNGVLFREGVNPKGQITFTPRLLLVDLQGSLRSLREHSELYETLPDPKQLTVEWPEHKIELQQKDVEPKNQFQTDLDKELSQTDYNLDHEVEVWSDYLYTRFHSRTVNVIKEYQYCNPDTPFDSFILGHSLWKTEQFQEEFIDKIRNYIEESDHFQGFHMLSDCTNGFAGLSAACLEHLKDEYTGKSVLVVPTIPSYFPDNDFTNPEEQVQSIMNDSVRVINLLYAFNSYREFGSMFVPVCTGEMGWRQPGPPKEFYHTIYNHKLPYHSSAILASALDTITLKYRLKSSGCSLVDVCTDLTGYGRKAVAASLCLPFSFSADTNLIDCLDQWDGPLFKSITPKCSIGDKYTMQHLVLRGIPESRLKKQENRAGNQKDLPAYRCNSVKEMMEFYLSCNTHASASHVTALEKGMPTKTPYPNIFDNKLGVDGNVQADQRLPGMRVESVPVLAGLHSGTETGTMLQSLYDESKKLKIARFHQFTFESDEYTELLNDLLTFRENYVDSFYD